MKVCLSVPERRFPIRACTVLMVSLSCTRMTYGQQSCDPNYANPPCVPIARDVDCAGGNGNGPAYVEGPVRVIGRDIYRLDRDGDGIACEPKKKKRK